MAEISSYPIFDPNQVLNHTHLNSMRDYLDEQSRLTRSKLIGTGIMCGFQLRLDEHNQLEVTAGCGITSLGYLACLESDTTFTHFKDYTEPSGYTPFTGLNLKVLLSEEEEGATALSSRPSFFNQRVVLCFVEYEDNKVNSCLVDDCDEHGTWRDFDLRFIALPKEAALNLLKQGTSRLAGFTSESQIVEFLNGKYRFIHPEVKRPSAWLGEDSWESLSSPALPEIAVFYMRSIRETLDQLMGALEHLYSVFQPVLSKTIRQVDYDNAIILLRSLHDYASEVESGASKPPSTIQYYYDLIKDLAAACREFQECAFDLMARCCPDDMAFPRHLFLGLPKDAARCEPSIYRHHFKQPPIYNGNQTRLPEVSHLFQKILLMVNESWLLEAFPAEPGEIKDIKITPSQSAPKPLSRRAIPYYYNVPGTKNSLYQYWSHDKYRKCQTDRNLSYHAANYSGHGSVLTPLDYTLDGFSFFRIEGHLGQDAELAYNEIESLRQKHNLPFELALLHDGGEALYTDASGACYDDLQANYDIWRNKLLLLVNNSILATHALETNFPSEGEDGDGILDVLRVILGERRDDQEKKEGREKETQEAEKEGETGVSKLNAGKAAVSGKKAESRFAATMRYANYIDKPDLMKAALKPGPGSKTSGYPGMYNMAANNISGAGEGIRLTEEEIRAAAAGNGARPASEPAYRSNDEKFALDRLKELNECLRGLIRSLKQDLKDFDFEDYHQHVHCLLMTGIHIMTYIADNHTQTQSRKNAGSNLELLGWIQRIINIIAIYPHIGIRNLLAHFYARKDAHGSSRDLRQYLMQNPGLEHRAGVPKGGVFFLVYREESGNGTVVADFCAPSMNCCDESECQTVAEPLIPLLVPVCRVLAMEVSDGESVYPQAVIQLLNNVYDPRTFEPYLFDDDGPKLGTAEFKDELYEPVPALNKKVLHYQVDAEALEEARRRRPDRLIFIDKFPYGIRDAAGESAGRSDIYIFINTEVPEEPPAKVFLDGHVYALNDDGENAPLAGAEVKDDSGGRTVSGEKGDYRLELTEGVHNITASFEGLESQTKTIEITAKGPNILDFSLTPKAKEMASVSGHVYSLLETGKSTPLAGANIKLSLSEVFETTSDKDGAYSFGVPAGNDYTFRCEAEGHEFQEKLIDDVKSDLELDFSLNALGAQSEGKYFELLDNMSIANDPVKAGEVTGKMDADMAKHRAAMEGLKNDPRVGPDDPVFEVAEAVNLFGGDEKLSIIKVNNEYSAKRDKLYANIRKSSGDDKALQVEAYNTLTLAYLNRLALEQPKKFSSGTMKTLAATASQMKEETALAGTVGAEFSAEMNGVLPDAFIANVRDNLYRG